MAADDLVRQAREALEGGNADRGRELVDRAHAADPADAGVTELYAQLHLAHAVRLAARAREARRRAIVARDIPYDVEFRDDPEVTRAFEEARSEIELVLSADPGHEKALMAKASLLFRQDRETNRTQALDILRGIAGAHPENRQIALAMRKMEGPCPRCSDTGFCAACRGRGSRRFLGLERRCDLCHGQGICPVCGIL